jgi:hypothetical protein
VVSRRALPTIPLAGDMKAYHADRVAGRIADTVRAELERG